MDKIPNPFKKKEDGAANPVTDLASKTADVTKKGVDETIAIAEKGVKAVDPLHLFDPSPIPTRLVLEHGLFNRVDTNPYPILIARSNDPFHNLAIRGIETASNVLVMEDTSTKEPVLIMDRTPEPRMYDIYKTRPMVEGQAVARKISDQDVYLRAKVLMSGEKGDLQVFREGQSEPTYTITKAPGLMNYSTKKVIYMTGGEKVASTSNWDDKSYMLEIIPGVDAGLLMCLGIIADDNSG